MITCCVHKLPRHIQAPLATKYPETFQELEIYLQIIYDQPSDYDRQERKQIPAQRSDEDSGIRRPSNFNYHKSNYYSNKTYKNNPPGNQQNNYNSRNYKSYRDNQNYNPKRIKKFTNHKQEDDMYNQGTYENRKFIRTTETKPRKGDEPKTITVRAITKDSSANSEASTSRD